MLQYATKQGLTNMNLILSKCPDFDGVILTLVLALNTTTNLGQANQTDTRHIQTKCDVIKQNESEVAYTNFKI